MPRHQAISASFIAVFIAISFPCTATAEVDFNRDVRPILSDKCYFCHGPDEENRAADLRLDDRDSAIEIIESGDLIERILSDDEFLRMPPPESNLSLTEEDKSIIRRWIEEGAVYEKHWAFEALPRSVPVATPDDPQWARKPLDEFVKAEMERVQLQPNPESTPLRWLRRVTLDLTGLPPTPKEIVSFEKLIAETSHREKAYGATVDRLLNSASFGEHMAIFWLDAARYADSYGYQSDKLNTQWPFRDWVVKAFNDNLPYDDFLTWQLAGDLLPNPTREQVLATAFNRIHRLNNEGGAVFEEWRIENVADRVHTFGTAVLGLTMECSRCHDHKYDPISAREYYSLSAFFNSIDESGVYDRTQKVPCPSLLLPSPDQQAEIDASLHAVEAAEEQLKSARDTSRVRYQQWRSEHDEVTKIPDLVLALGFDRPFDNALKKLYHPSQSDRSWAPMVDLIEVQDCTVARLPPHDAADAEDADLPRRALKLDGERGVTTEGITPFDRWTPFSVVITLREQKRVADRAVIAHHTRGTDCGYNGWDLTIVDGYLESRMYRVWPGNAIGVRTSEPIPHDHWHQVTATYDGSSKAGGLKLFLNGRELPTSVLRDEVKKSADVVVDHGGQFVVGQRFRARGLADGLIDDVRVYSRALTRSEMRFLATGEKIEPTAAYFESAIDDDCRDAMKRLTSAREQWVMAEEVVDEIPVMRETEQPRPAHVLARGQYDAPTDESTLVGREVIAALGIPFPEDASRDRLGLARWVTHPEHPLTARVAVNRLWASFFAEPLVGTPENFGLQGNLPTHPELLDFLARDFVDNGWDVKRFCRDVVMSATYRQESATSPEKLKFDPTNQFLSRGPAHRLSAEQIRDSALAASGLLNPERGGPPVSPYQPGEDLWRESNGMSPAYQQSVGESLYRRSLYSVWKRTAPLPNMMAFDATSREVCSVKRARTNTPLQALVLLNDTQFVEAARALATRLLRRGELDDDELVSEAFLAFSGRRPDQKERATLQQYYIDEKSWFQDHPEAATELLHIGDEPAESSIPTHELAAMTTVCQAILNLDAVVWKR
ncbi:MAG: DUF1553 domain-containing protein [Planctomycetota bacterium]